MIFNGHTTQDIDALDEATMNQIIVMYADGLIGNKSIVTGIGTLTSGVFNYMRSPNSTPYNLKSILGNTYDYFYPSEKADPDDALLTFMSQAPGFEMDRFKRK